MPKQVPGQPAPIGAPPPGHQAGTTPPPTRQNGGHQPIGPDDRAENTTAWWAGTREAPVPWDERATVRFNPGALRLPAPDDPAPATTRMLGVCAWAAALGVVGVAVAARAVVALLAGSAPAWYEATVIAGGLAGITLTAASFLSVHHPRLPWALLGAATVPLAINVIGTALAL